MTFPKSLIVALACCTTMVTQAQTALAWRVMPEARFGGSLQTLASPEEHSLAYSLYRAKVDEAVKDGVGALVLLGSADTQQGRVIFSMHWGLNSKCTAPLNGDGTSRGVALYATCPLEIHVQNSTTKRLHGKSIGGSFCYLNDDGARGGIRDNHTEYAYDKATNTLHLRTIMYGKQVPECNRSLRLK